jgi:predicted transcriptional regulator
MIESLEKLSETKVKLSVPLIASFITKRYRQSDIARACNVSDQAVSSYIKKHYEELLPLVDTSDGLSAMMSKHIATKAKERIDNILTVDTFNKKDLVALNITAGTQIDKYRLLSDKSTSNVSIDTIDAEINELTEREKELEAQLRELEGDSGMEGSGGCEG